MTEIKPKKKRYDITISRSKDKGSGVEDSFRDTWGPRRSINVGGHAGVRETEKLFEPVDGAED